MNLKTINLFLVGLLFVFLTSCGGGSGNKNEGKTTDTTQQDEGKQPDKGETANNESSSTESTAKPADGYVLISNQMGKVTVAQYKDGTVEQTKQMQMDLTKYGGELSFPKYNSANSYYTVQYNAAMDKFYVSMMSANMLQGTFDWFKFIEYSVKDGTSKEVASLKEQVHSWYYVESVNKIIGVLQNKMVSNVS